MSLISHAINASNRYFTYESASQYNTLLNAGTPRVYAGDATPTIDVDDAIGLSTAHASHVGASGIAMKAHSEYSTYKGSWNEFERVTAQVKWTEADSGNWYSYLKATFLSAGLP